MMDVNKPFSKSLGDLSDPTNYETEQMSKILSITVDSYHPESLIGVNDDPFFLLERDGERKFGLLHVTVTFKRIFYYWSFPPSRCLFKEYCLLVEGM